jgi:hypothetical protein
VDVEAVAAEPIEDGPSIAPPLAVGDPVTVRIRAGAVAARGVIVSRVEGVLEVRTSSPLDVPGGRFGIRRVGADGNAWFAEAEGRPTADPLLLEVVDPHHWAAVEARRAARFSADRQPVVAEPLVPASFRRELTALDVSATGCRLAATAATMLVPGWTVRLSLDMGSYVERRWIHGVVVRATRGSFGRSELGLRFQPASDAERRLVLTWRDTAASRTAPAEQPVAVVPALV